jgi:hypothetical protein
VIDFAQYAQVAQMIDAVCDIRSNIPVNVGVYNTDSIDNCRYRLKGTLNVWLVATAK